MVKKDKVHILTNGLNADSKTSLRSIWTNTLDSLRIIPSLIILSCSASSFRLVRFCLFVFGDSQNKGICITDTPFSFETVDIPPSQVNILDGNAEDLVAECKAYEERTKKYGGIELFLGGIGEDGHIAFNVGS